MNAPDRANLLAALDDSALNAYRAEILNLLDERYNHPKHGHFKEWKEVYQNLTTYHASVTDFKADLVSIGKKEDISESERANLENKLKLLSPWRKGPFNIFGIHIDTEWRSDWKWSRIEPHIDLKGKLILDVGCGNGYYALRMQGMGAKMVLGVDPSWHYVFQFHTLQKYSSQAQKAYVLPFTFEEFPQTENVFDCVFSMGVLYHRRDPIIHLKQLHSILSSKGELILETLIIDEENEAVLIPKERYANMRNVWAIPSVNALKSWLGQAGFSTIKVVDITATTKDEQRQTKWMTRFSLEQALNPDDHDLTIEGYPAPLRITLIAHK